MQVIQLSERLEEAEGGAESQVINRSIIEHSNFDCVYFRVVRNQQEEGHRIVEVAQTSRRCPSRIRRNRQHPQEETPGNRR